MKIAYEIYAELYRLGGHIYIRDGKLHAGPARVIRPGLRTSMRENKEDIRAIASVLQASLNFKLEEMVDEVFTHSEARFCVDTLPTEQLLSYEEIQERLNERTKKI